MISLIGGIIGLVVEFIKLYLRFNTPEYKIEEIEREIKKWETRKVKAAWENDRAMVAAANALLGWLWESRAKHNK